MDDAADEVQAGASAEDLGGIQDPGGFPDDLPDDHPDEEDDDTDGDWLYTRGTIHDFEIGLSDDAIGRLYAAPSEDVHATFGWAGRTWDVGLHLKGNYSFRSLGGKASFKIDFHQWDPEASFDGVRRLTLNNMVQDGSMLSENTIYRLFRAMDVPAPRHGYARVWVNGEWYGLYGIVETLDEQFLGDHFGSDEGNLYAGGYGADVREGRADEFVLEEQGDAVEPWTDLEGMVESVAGVEDGALLEEIARWFDDEALFRLLAVELVAGQSDGYVTYANNYMLYDDLGRWSMVPWGQDQAFKRTGSVYSGWHGQLILRCGNISACRDRLDTAIVEVLDTWNTMDLAATTTEVQAAIAEDCEADPRREQNCGGNQEELLEYVNERPAQVWSEVR